MQQRCVFLVGPKRIEIREIGIPRPNDGEVLLKIIAATTCGTDLKVYLRGSHPTMLEAPCPFGHEMTGSISAIGKGVDQFCEGDQVIIANSASCGYCAACMAGRENLCYDLQYINGAFAEYILIPQRFVKRSTYHKPSSLVSSIAPIAEPLACVLHGLEMCAPHSTRRAVVLGGGPIGQMFVIELVRMGFEVTLGDLSQERLNIGTQLGASHSIRLSGYPDDDVALLGATSPNNDLIIEATGKRNAWRSAFGAIVPGGEIILFGGTPPGSAITIDSHRLHYSEISVKGVYHHRPQTFLAAIERLTEAGHTYTALVNQECGLDGVENALRSMKEQKILKACIRPDLL